MILKSWLRAYAIRRALSVGLAMVISLFVSRFLSDPSPGWLVITALVVSQTTRGTPLRQSFFYLFFIVIGVLGVSIFHPLLMDWAYAVVMGGLIGIACGQLILPVRPFREFSQGLLPILQAIKSFNIELANLFVTGNGFNAVDLAKQEVEKALFTRYGMYPEWVYEVGFNRGLRAGYRFFLVNIERVTEIVFSLNLRASFLKDIELPQALAGELNIVLLKNNELLQQLESYLLSQTFTLSHDDYTSDMAALEGKAKSYIPQRLDLLDTYPDAISLVVLLRDIKDMRQQLLALMLAATTKQDSKNEKSA